VSYFVVVFSLYDFSCGFPPDDRPGHLARNVDVIMGVLGGGDAKKKKRRGRGIDDDNNEDHHHYHRKEDDEDKVDWGSVLLKEIIAEEGARIAMESCNMVEGLDCASAFNCI
jgi:hypothetical protein